ncbi:MAG: hypothetical protein ACI9ES_000593 [Oceanospirillaceae bacterium]|jgi:hypothetical protein
MGAEFIDLPAGVNRLSRISYFFFLTGENCMKIQQIIADKSISS